MSYKDETEMKFAAIPSFPLNFEYLDLSYQEPELSFATPKVSD
jgi:hypothetical protein